MDQLPNIVGDVQSRPGLRFTLDPNWIPVPSHRHDQGGVKLVWLQGTPYQMGYQHGHLLHDEIGSLPYSFIRGVNFLAQRLGLGRFARKRTFQDVVEECEGLTAATADLGFTFEGWLAIALGDVFQEFIRDVIPLLFNYRLDFSRWLPGSEFGCSQMIAAGAATVDGRLYHGDNLDCPRRPVRHWLDHTTLFIRQPNYGIPHVSIAVPGALWPNSGLNAAGISLAFNTAHPGGLNQLSLSGRSHVQMMAQVLKQASSYAEARGIMTAHPHMTADLVAIADGVSKQAGIFEMTAQHLAVRELDANGILYVTNHFVAPAMQNRDQTPPRLSSVTRYERFKQLLDPAGLQTHHSSINLEVVMALLRDRINPYTFRESPLEVYDDNASIATNGLIRQVVFEPESLSFWMAVGDLPVSKTPFMKFSLAEMLTV